MHIALRSHRTPRRYLLAAAAFALCSLSASAQRPDGSKLTTVLADLSQAVTQDPAGRSTARRVTTLSPDAMPRSVQDAMRGGLLRINANNEVQVYILMSAVTDATVAELTAAGVTIEIRDPERRRVQARIAVSSLQAVARAGDRRRRPPADLRAASHRARDERRGRDPSCRRRAVAVLARRHRRARRRRLRRPQGRLRDRLHHVRGRLGRTDVDGRSADRVRHQKRARRPDAVGRRDRRPLVPGQRRSRGSAAGDPRVRFSGSGRRRHGAARDRARHRAGREAVVRQRRHRSRVQSGGQFPGRVERRRAGRHRVLRRAVRRHERRLAQSRPRRSTTPRIRFAATSPRWATMPTSTTSAPTSTRASTARRSAASRNRTPASVSAHGRHDRRPGPRRAALQPDSAAAERRGRDLPDVGRCLWRVGQQLRSVSGSAEHREGRGEQHRRPERQAGSRRGDRLRQQGQCGRLPHRRAERGERGAAEAPQYFLVRAGVRGRGPGAAGAAAARTAQLQHRQPQHFRAGRRGRLAGERRVGWRDLLGVGGSRRAAFRRARPTSRVSTRRIRRPNSSAAAARRSTAARSPTSPPSTASRCSGRAAFRRRSSGRPRPRRTWVGLPRCCCRARRAC